MEIKKYYKTSERLQMRWVRFKEDERSYVGYEVTETRKSGRQTLSEKEARVTTQVDHPKMSRNSSQVHSEENSLEKDSET